MVELVPRQHLDDGSERAVRLPEQQRVATTKLRVEDADALAAEAEDVIGLAGPVELLGVDGPGPPKG